MDDMGMACEQDQKATLGRRESTANYAIAAPVCTRANTKHIQDRDRCGVCQEGLRSGAAGPARWRMGIDVIKSKLDMTQATLCSLPLNGYKEITCWKVHCVV